MRHSSLRRLAVALPLCAAAFTTSQPAPERIRDGCTSCAIQLRPLYTTRDPNGSLVDPAYSIFEAAGKLVVGARQPLQVLPVVFDSTGAYLRDIGRPGPGPGEITLPVWTQHLAADTIRVFMAGRASDFTTDGMFVRSVAQLGGSGFVNALHLFPSGTNVIATAGPGRPAGKDDSPLVVRGADGALLRRLELADTRGQWVHRVLGRARHHEGEQFWVVQAGPFNPRGYTAILVSTDGRVHRSLSHEPSWWLFFAADSRGAMTGPNSKVAAVHERRDGKLLVLVSQAKANWKSIPPGRFGRFEHVYEKRLIAIDLRTSTVVGAATLPGGPAFFLSDTRLVLGSETADGEPQLTVYELRLP